MTPKKTAAAGYQHPDVPWKLCAYWVGSDTTGRRCTAISVKGGYCEKHYAIVLDRTKKKLDKERARAARDNAAWFARNVHRAPSWRAQLERAEAEYARRTASPVNDRAAVGGDTHRSIVRGQARHLSDSNVARVVELGRIIKKLRADLARLEADA